jgi:hypothetical protein
MVFHMNGDLFQLRIEHPYDFCREETCMMISTLCPVSGSRMRYSPDKGTASFWTRGLAATKLARPTRIDFENIDRRKIPVHVPFVPRLFHPVCRV